MPFELGKELDLKFAEDIENKINGIDEDLASKSARMNQIEQDAATSMTKIEQDSINRDNSHANSTKAHKAENIEYSGKVTGKSNVKDGLDSIQDQVNAIIVTATSQGSYGPEIEGARIGKDGTVHPILKNRLDKMDQDITDANTQLKQTGRATQTLIHGPYNVLNGTQNAPVNIQIEGRTLIPMQNNVLDALKYYVLADKKTWLKWADASLTKGIAKFTGKAEKPIVIRIANFENKVSGSNLENPHLFRQNNNETLNRLRNVSDWNGIGEGNYGIISTLSGSSYSSSTLTNGAQSQHYIVIDMIAEIERNVGRIPRATVADKIQWLKDNVTFVLNWHGLGSSVGGNKASIRIWSARYSTWDGAEYHTSSTVFKRFYIIDQTTISDYIDNDGMVRLSAFAEPSDGTIASVISTKYVDCEITLKSTAVLNDPRVPLYEVTQAHYDQMFTTMLEDEITRRYPSVAGATHLQNPYLMAEGSNLLPPVFEWIQIATTATMKDLYELEQNATGSFQSSYVIVPASPNQTYTASKDDTTGRLVILVQNRAGTWRELGFSSQKYTFTTNVDDVAIRYQVDNHTAVSGKFNYKGMMLTVGDTVKQFTPRNPSYLFFETKLASLPGTNIADRVFEDNGKYVKRKEIEEIVLDGSLPWLWHADQSGYKEVHLQNVFTTPIKDGFVVDYIGKKLGRGWYAGSFTFYTTVAGGAEKHLYLCLPDTLTGFGETYAPNSNEFKAFFNGWQAKTVDANGKPTAWKSLVDGADAPTQTEAYVAANKAPNYTPYKFNYALAAPTTEEIKHEGSIFANGLTMVDVGAGVVFREKVTPIFTGGSYRINQNAFPTSNTKNRIQKFIAIYKNGVLEAKDKYISIYKNADGTPFIEYLAPNFDTTAEYSVTYTVWDKQTFTSNPVNVTAQYANNIRTALEDTAKKVEDVATETTVIKNTYAKKSKYPWIAPTLLNAWVNFGGAYATVGYTKDDLGYVHLRGLIKSGTIAQVAFVLPVGFRPEKDMLIATTSNGAFGQLSIRTDGQVFIESGSNINFSLEGILFRTEG